MLNERLKNLRLAKGMTLQQVGDAFGISKASVSSWESGKSNPDHKKIEKLAELFETSVQFLISGISSVANPENIGVPFFSWNNVSSRNAKSTEDSQTVTPLHSRPGVNSFATRYPGSSDRNWQFKGIPAGSLLIVDPDLEPGPLTTVLMLFDDGALGLAKFEQTPENKKILIAADTSNFQIIPTSSIRILGVVLEWQLSGKLI
jgi:transcriptional regulator with XRE-family HTH domain